MTTTPTTPTSPALPVHHVVTYDEFADVAKDLARQKQIAFDTESNGFFRYPERVCLLQFATPNDIYIVDPLAFEDVSLLGPVLRDPRIEKVLHGADYDLRSLDREWGFRIVNLYDTGIAAHFTGMNRLGLGVLLEEVLGVTVAKEKRLQRADWSIRPLTDEALEYAATDVVHLLELRRVLGEKVEALARTEWVTEELARLAEVRYAPADPETAFLSMKGAGALDPRALALLKSLLAYREALARRLGRPPFRVISEKALLFLAENPEADLADVPGLGDYAIRRWSSGLRQAVKEGMAAPPVHRPRVMRERITEAEMKRRMKALQDLKAWRTEEGAALGLDPAVVWPMVSMERLARDPEALDAEIASPEVRAWQRREIAPKLRAKLAEPAEALEALPPM